MAEREQVAVDGAVDRHRLARREQRVVDRLVGRNGHEPSLRRISNAWPIDGSATTTASSAAATPANARVAHGRDREPSDEREHERRADEVQRSSPHSSSLVNDESHDIDGALEERARFQWVEPREAARDRRSDGAPERVAEAADERDAEHEHDEVARARRRREAGNRRRVFDVPQRERAARRSLAAAPRCVCGKRRKSLRVARASTASRAASAPSAYIEWVIGEGQVMAFPRQVLPALL